MDRKEYQNEWKKKQRDDNTNYAKKVREAKRSDIVKTRRNELRQRPEAKEKERLYQKEYRKRPEVKTKNKARHAVKKALIEGVIKRPNNCELCNCKDNRLRDGRSGLRADHYLGYEKENHLKVKFICLKCDGKQLRKDHASN